MLEVVNLARPYLEATYFVAGTLLAVGLVLTFRQLILLRTDIDLRSERAAKEKALEACDRYFQRYVTEIDELSTLLKDKKLEGYKGTIGDFSIGSLPAPLLRAATARLSVARCHVPLNELEAISAFFVSGVAEETTGFGIIGRTFCATVESHYDIIAACRTDAANPYWNNIVQLYKIWRPRLTKAEIQIAKDNLEKMIRQMDDNGISPIGPKKPR